MKVVVASRNPVKLGAVRHGFKTQFPGVTVEVIAIDVATGVGDQPVSDDETREGARTRALNAQCRVPDAAYWVGLEGGTELLDGELMAFAWSAVKARDGRFGEARSVTLPLPPAIRELVATGLELGEANDRVFSTVNSKQGGGAFGLLTDGLYTRESIYTQTVVMSLVPFVNPLFEERPAP